MFSIRKYLVNRFSFSWVTVLILCLTTFNSAHACFFVSLAKNGSAFVGYNEDGFDLRAKIWFFPATDKAYGRVIWGFDRAVFPYQGGMNDQGLFVDFNALNAHSGWKDDPQKSNLDGATDLIEYILINIATVDEAIEFFKKYNVDLSYGMVVIADARGQSVIFEWAKDQLQILRKDQGYQICTNDLQSTVDIPSQYPCQRWKIADQMLRNQNTPSVDLIRRVLSATCAQFYFCATTYSTICDLAHKKIYLYNFHNFEEAVVFDLKYELARGESGYSIPDLFQVKPYSLETQKRIGIQWGDVKLQNTIDEKGIKEGISALQAMKDETRSYNKYIFQEWVIKNAGMHYLSKNKIEEAIEIFKLNVQEYPESWEVYSDLANAYLKNQNIPLAIEYYEKALERNPDNKKIEGILNRLKNDDK